MLGVFRSNQLLSDHFLFNRKWSCSAAPSGWGFKIKLLDLQNKSLHLSLFHLLVRGRLMKMRQDDEDETDWLKASFDRSDQVLKPENRRRSTCVPGGQTLQLPVVIHGHGSGSGPVQFLLWLLVLLLQLRLFYCPLCLRWKTEGHQQATTEPEVLITSRTTRQVLLTDSWFWEPVRDSAGPGLFNTRVGSSASSWFRSLEASSACSSWDTRSLDLRSSGPPDGTCEVQEASLWGQHAVNFPYSTSNTLFLLFPVLKFRNRSGSDAYWAQIRTFSVLCRWKQLIKTEELGFKNI